MLLFDTSSMQDEEVDRAIKAATKYVDEQMSVADLVAVATVGPDPDDPSRLHLRSRRAESSPWLRWT